MLIAASVAALVALWVMTVRHVHAGDPSRAELAAASAAASAAGARAYASSQAEVARPVVAYIGDSYSAGTGSSATARRFTTLLAGAEGWREWNVARGGTGYAKALTGADARAGCGLDVCPNYDGMIPAAGMTGPDAVIVCGGRNDIGATANADEQQAVAKFYHDLRAALPKTSIIATSPIWSAETPPAQLARIADDVRAAVNSVGGTYLDIGEPLGGHPELVASDGIHPNDAGHRAITAAIEAALKQSAVSVKKT